MSALDVRAHARDTALQYDIDVIATEIGTGRNHALLQGLADAGVEVQTVNASLCGDRHDLELFGHNPFAPVPGTQAVIVDEVSSLSDSTRAWALEQIITHSLQVPFVLSESIYAGSTAETIREALSPVFSQRVREIRLVHSNI